MSNDTLSGRIDLDVAGATNALAAARKAFRDLASASTAAGKQMTASQRAAANAIINDYKKLREAQSKVVTGAIEMERKLKESERNGRANRSNSKGVAVAKIGDLNESAEARKTAALSKQQAAAQKLITEQVRLRIAVENAGAARQKEHFRQELALRKQIHREAQAVNRTQAEGMVTMSGMRYALYDVSSTFRTMGLAAIAAATSVFTVGVAWEKAFADVIRTTGAAGKEVGYLKAQFTSLVQTLPVSWEKLTEIGTLAGQLGVAKQNIAEFTRTVAMFSATTDVSVDAAATAFGRLDSIIPSVKGNYAGLANSILKVGVNSVATESQIIKITTQIASIAAPAGYSYDQIIGLSGALASVAVPPELARGVMTRTFGRIGAAVSDGGLQLEKFARASGMSGDQFKVAWKSDAAATFQTFVGRLAESGEEADRTLKSLGITSVRDVPILKRLGGAADSAGNRFDSLTGKGGLLNQTMADAADATGELQKQYNVISGTVGAKLQMMLQSIQAAFDKISGTQMGALGNAIDDITNYIHDFTDALDDNVRIFDLFQLDMTNGEALGGLSALAAGLGVAALAIAAFGQVAAGGMAMGTVVSSLGKYFDKHKALSAVQRESTLITNAMQTATGGYAGTVVTMTDGVSRSTKQVGKWGKALGVVKSIAGGLKTQLGLMAAVAGIGFLVKLSEDARKLGSSGDEVTNSFLTATSAIGLLKDIKINQGDPIGGEVLKPFMTDIKDLGKGLDAIGTGGFWNDFAAKNKAIFTGTAKTSTGFDTMTAGLEKLDAGFGQLAANGNGAKAIESMQGIVASANLNDHQLDVFIQRMPEYERALRSSLDGKGITDSWKHMREEARGAIPAMQAAAVAASGIMEGVVDVAFAGSDEDALAFIASIGQVLSATVDMGTAYSDSLKAANDKARVSWVAAGNDVSDFKDVAVASLSDFLTVMDTKVEEMREKAKNLGIIALKGGQEAADAAGKLPAELIAQIAAAALAGGAEFEKFIAMVDLTSKDSIALLTANIANLTPGVIEEFAALGGGSMDALLEAIAVGDRTVQQILDDLRQKQKDNPVVIPVRADAALARQEAASFLNYVNSLRGTINVNANVVNKGALESYLNTSGLSLSGKNRQNAGMVGGVTSGFSGGQFSDGGYTGDGGMYAPAGIVHKGEFVMTKKAVDGLGTSYLYNLMRAGQKGYSGGGAVTQSSNSYVPSYGGGRASTRASKSTPQIVELSPIDRQLLTDAGNLQFIIPGSTIAKAVSANNINSATRRKA